MANWGPLIAITGCMFSGKTSELVRYCDRAKRAKRQVLAVKPKIDQRYAVNNIASHDGQQLEAVVVSSGVEILSLVTKSEGKVDLVAIDEGQFFGDDLPVIIRRLMEMGKDVVVAGLDQDFRGEPFGPMPHLLAIAQTVLKLTAICQVCGKEATQTQRLINGEPAPWDSRLVMVGANELYEARCLDCWEVPGKLQSISDPQLSLF